MDNYTTRFVYANFQRMPTFARVQSAFLLICGIGAIRRTDDFPAALRVASLVLWMPQDTHFLTIESIFPCKLFGLILLDDSLINETSYSRNNQWTIYNMHCLIICVTRGFLIFNCQCHDIGVIISVCSLYYRSKYAVNTYSYVRKIIHLCM